MSNKQDSTAGLFDRSDPEKSPGFARDAGTFDRAFGAFVDRLEERWDKISVHREGGAPRAAAALEGFPKSVVEDGGGAVRGSLGVRRPQRVRLAGVPLEGRDWRAVLSITSLPWMCGATVRSMNHVRAMTTTRFDETETCIMGLITHALIASSIFLLPLLSNIPIPVVSGCFSSWDGSS